MDYEGFLLRSTGRLLWRSELFLQLCRGDDAGQSAVELALCLPALLMVVTGIATFGLALNNYVTLTEATSVGARQISVQRGQTGDPCALASSALQSAAPLLKYTGSASTGLAMTFKVYTTATASTTYSAMPATCSAAALTQGMPVTVTATYPCTLQVYGHNYAPSCFLTAQSTEVTQ